MADVVVGDDVLTSLAGAIRERGFSRARIGIAGSDVLPHSVFRALERELPEVRWEEARRHPDRAADGEVARRDRHLAPRIANRLLRDRADDGGCAAWRDAWRDHGRRPAGDRAQRAASSTTIS